MHSQLQDRIVEIHGAPVNAARDCEVLAKNISAQTGRSVSSTTLRRFFGLLRSTSSISTYNLDTLAIYCGARDYKAFCVAGELPGEGTDLQGDGARRSVPGEDQSVPGEDKSAPGEDQSVPGEDQTLPGEDQSVPGEDQTLPGEDQSGSGANQSGSGAALSRSGAYQSGSGAYLPGNVAGTAGRNASLSDELEQITRQTLTGIERRSLGGFRRTIPRMELNHTLKAFLLSEKPVYPVIAPSGFGKSVALAHWVREVMEKHYCLFCGAGLFQSMLEGRGVTRDQPRLTLDDPGNIFQVIRTLPPREQPLLVVIDALDEISNDPKRLLRLVDYLFDASASFHGEVKFVFSIKEATWRTYLQERFENEAAAKPAEQVSPLPETGYTNMPQLSNSEIRRIIANDDRNADKPFIFECIPWDIRELLRIPIQLYLVGRLFETIPSLEHLSRTDVIREYLSEFLFRSKYAEGKEDIAWKIFDMMEAQGDHLPVRKNALKEQLPVHLKRETAYYQAYQEMLHDGILIEEREENIYGIFVTRVGFSHQDFFVYLLCTVPDPAGRRDFLFTHLRYCKAQGK